MKTNFFFKLSILLNVVLVSVLSIFYLQNQRIEVVTTKDKINPITTAEYTAVVNTSTNEVGVLVKEPIVESFIPTPSEPTQPARTYYTPSDVNILSRLVYGEGRGLNKTEMSAIVWVVLNRVDSPLFPNSIYEVIMQPGQFYTHEPNFPVWDNIQELVIDVLNRWSSEKNGVADVGRTLPNDYFFYWGDGYHNYFRKGYKDQVYYNWWMTSPY